MQTDLFAPSATEIAENARRTGLIPTIDEQAGLSDDEKRSVLQAWFRGVHEIADRGRRAAVAKFAEKGWPFAWLVTYGQTQSPEPSQADAIEEALNVIEHHYRPIADRGLDHPDDMGLLASRGFGASEGIMVKREPYGSNILVSVYAVTGDRNFDVGSGTVEFEPGSKSHIFHLVYTELPSTERLLGDVAAYPIIRSVENRMEAHHGRWEGEGWKGKSETRPFRHRPWDTLSSRDVRALQGEVQLENAC